MKRILLLSLLGLLSFNLAAQKTRVIRGWTVQTENDVIPGLVKLRNDDKDYSGGFKFEFYTDYLKKGIFPLFRNRFPGNDEDAPFKNLNSIYIQGMGYTPDRTAFHLTEPDSTQRPFASLIGIGRRRVAVFYGDSTKHWHKVITSDFFVGRVGSRGARNVQNFLHEYVTNSDFVRGWHNQIAAGGKWVANYNLKLGFGYLFKPLSNNKDGFTITPHASLGNLFLGGGVKIALTDQTAFENAITLSMNSNQFPKIVEPKKSAKRSFKTVLRETFLRVSKRMNYEGYVRPQAVVYNTLLMGMPYYDNSAYVIPKSQIRRLVVDLGGKLTYSYNPDFRAGKPAANNRRTTVFLELLYRSKEFGYGKTHLFGNFGFTIMKTN